VDGRRPRRLGAGRFEDGGPAGDGEVGEFGAGGPAGDGEVGEFGAGGTDDEGPSEGGDGDGASDFVRVSWITGSDVIRGGTRGGTTTDDAYAAPDA